MSVLTVEVDKDIQLKPNAQRILLKSIKTMDDLIQLYFVLKDSVEVGSVVNVEVWENINGDTG